MVKIERFKHETKLPKVTVVTATFNLLAAQREESLKECLNSVQIQTYPNIEHIIIDGASNNGTLTLLKNLSMDKRTKIYSEKDKGIYDAYNKGIQKATGKYIVFLGTDDMFAHKSVIAENVDLLEKENADWSYADTWRHNPKTGDIILWKGVLDYIPFGYFPCHQTIFAKTDVLRKLGLFHDQLTNADNELMMRLIAGNHKSVKVPSVTAIFKENGKGSSREMTASIRKSHTKAFYELFGKTWGMTPAECGVLYNNDFWFKLEGAAFTNLGLKLKKDIWLQAYFSHETFHFDPVYPTFSSGNESLDKKTYRAQSTAYLWRFPLWRTKIKGKTTRVYVLGLPLLKIKRKENV